RATLREACDRRTAPTARHVQVAALPVNNRPETGERSLRSSPTPAGWCFAPALPLGLPKCAARTGPSCWGASQRQWDHKRAHGLGCAAMRCVSKHEGHAIAVLILRDARTRVHTSRKRLRMRAPQDEDGIAFQPISRCQTAQIFSFPRRVFAPGFCNFASLTPNRGVGGAPRNVRVLGGTPVGPAHDAAGQALARRLASHDAGRSPLGAPPWRFWAPGAALLSPAFAPDRLQRAPRSQVVVPGGRLPGPPGASGYQPPPQDATPRSAFRIVSRTRPQ